MKLSIKFTPENSSRIRYGGIYKVSCRVRVSKLLLLKWKVHLWYLGGKYVARPCNDVLKCGWLSLSLFLSLCVQAEKRQGNRERSNEDVVSYIRSTVYEPGMVLRSKKRRIKSLCNWGSAIIKRYKGYLRVNWTGTQKLANLQFVRKRRKILFTHSIFLKYIYIELKDWAYLEFLEIRVHWSVTTIDIDLLQQWHDR